MIASVRRRAISEARADMRIAQDSIATMGKMKSYATFDLYQADQSPKNRTLIRALRKFVARAAPKLEESVKWGNGCWVQGKDPVCYVYSAVGYVQFGFFRGASLRDPRGLL